MIQNRYISVFERQILHRNRFSKRRFCRPPVRLDRVFGLAGSLDHVHEKSVVLYRCLEKSLDQAELVGAALKEKSHDQKGFDRLLAKRDRTE